MRFFLFCVDNIFRRWYSIAIKKNKRDAERRSGDPIALEQRHKTIGGENDRIYQKEKVRSDGQGISTTKSNEIKSIEREGTVRWALHKQYRIEQNLSKAGTVRWERQ